MSAFRKEISQVGCALSAYLAISPGKVMETLICSNHDKRGKRERSKSNKSFQLYGKQPRPGEAALITLIILAAPAAAAVPSRRRCT